MTITGHADRSVFTRYNVRRDDVQAHALAQQESYLAGEARHPGDTSAAQEASAGQLSTTVGRDAVADHRTPD